MKNVVGLEIYRQYQKDIEQLKHQVMENRSENDNDTSLLLVHNDEERQTIVRYFAITMVLVILLSGLLLTITKTYSLWKYFWIIGLLYLAWGITFIVLFRINKVKKKKILEEKEKKNQIELDVVKKFKELQDSFYSIVVYIICINDFYHELIKLTEEERKEKWQEIVNREIEVINQDLNYNISLASYQQYFSAWLANQEVYG